MFYSTRWASLPGWFLSGDLLITRWLLISGKSVRCIYLPMLDCSKNSSCQEIRADIQMFRASGTAASQEIFGYLSQWKQTGSCAFKCMQMAKYMWYCAQKGQQTYYLQPMVCMHLPCMQTDLVDHTQTIAKKKHFPSVLRHMSCSESGQYHTGTERPALTEISVGFALFRLQQITIYPQL